MDIAVNSGTPVFAVEAATVIRSKYVRGYGNLVELRHSNMYSSRYGHNSKNLVKKGQRIKKGHVIALSGNTGRSTGPHVHFEVRQSGVAINPFKYLGAMKHFSLASNIPISKYVRVSSR
jgi:murein DD-endopeptidase MepM/ murein hydrolase activator NlpD